MAHSPLVEPTPHLISKTLKTKKTLSRCRYSAITTSLLIVALCVGVRLQAQFLFPTMGAHSIGLGGATTALNDIESAFNNDVGFAYNDKIKIIVAYRQQFHNNDFNTYYLGGAVPISFGTIALSAISFGDNDYSEQRITAHYAIPLNDKIALGIAFHLLQSIISDGYYPRQDLLTFSVAMQYKASDKLQVGFRLFNPTAVKTHGINTLRTVTLISLGVSYQPFDQLITTAEVEKTLYHNHTIRCGLDYLLMNRLHLLAGIASYPLSYSFGVGTDFDHWQLNVATEIHHQLGISPHLSILYSF